MSELTITQLLEGLKKIVKSDWEGRYVYDVVLFDDDGNESGKYNIAVDPGSVEWAEGESGEDGAIPFHIKKGGIETLKALQTDGLSAAISFMFDGSIYTTNIKGAEKWFEIFEIGPEAIAKIGG